MPFNFYLGILIICSIALVPLFCYETATDNPISGILSTVVLATILVIHIAHGKASKAHLQGKIRLWIVRTLRCKTFYVLLGYIILLVAFYYLLAEYIILDI